MNQVEPDLVERLNKHGAYLCREAADAILQLQGEVARMRAELNETREVCPLVRRQDYFDVPTPVLVEAQIEAARWSVYGDFITVAEFQRPPIDGVLKRFRARALSGVSS